MSTENAPAAAPAKQSRVNRSPDHKTPDGRIAVWLDPRQDNPTKIAASIAFTVGGTKQYFKVGNIEVNGVKLSAEEIAGIFADNDLPVEFPSTSGEGTYTASLAKREIKPVAWKMDPTRFDQYMNIGIAMHLTKASKDNPGTREHWGYSVEKVSFPRFIKHGEEMLELSARQVFQLNNRETIKLGDVSVKLDRIEEEGKYQRARIATSSETPVQVVSEADTVPVNESPGVRV